MASIPGTIPVTSGIAPTDTTDTFATHIDIYGQGGYMTVADTAARNSITEDRRKLGMAVCTTTDNKIFTLTTNPAGATTVDTDWTEFTGGSSLAIEDEGTQLTAAAASIDFVGAGVTATNSGADVTVTIPGGASDLQSVLEGGSQFVQPNGYTGGILSVKYTGPTGNPSDPTVNSTGVLIDANSTGTNNGENLMIAASGSADVAFVTLHAQNVNSLPIGPVPYSRLEVKQDDIVVDTNSASWQGTSAGDVLSIKSVNPGIGTNGFTYIIETKTIALTPDMQDVFDNSTPNITAIDAAKKLSLSAGDVDILTSDADGGSSKIVLQASNSTTGAVNELDIDATTNLTTLTTQNLDVEVRASIGTGTPEVGDVLIIDQLINTTYGRLKYKPGVQIQRVQVSSSQLQNLFTTPVNLINGISGRYIMILEAYVALFSTTIGYNAGVKLQIQNTTYNIPVLETNEFLQSTAGGCRVFYPMDPSTIGPNDRPVSSSAGWELTCTADLGTSGDGGLDMFISYIVIP